MLCNFTLNIELELYVWPQSLSIRGNETRTEDRLLLLIYKRKYYYEYLHVEKHKL